MGTEFPWRWGRGRISANLDVIWGMSVSSKTKTKTTTRINYLPIEVLVDPLTATQLSDTVLAAQALQNDPDLLFGAELPTSRPPDVLHDLLGRCFLVIGVPSHLQSLVG